MFLPLNVCLRTHVKSLVANGVSKVECALLCKVKASSLAIAYVTELSRQGKSRLLSEVFLHSRKLLVHDIVSLVGQRVYLAK